MRKLRQPPSTETFHTLHIGHLSGRRRGAILKEEVWVDSSGMVVKYSLAYINPAQCAADNGRVLGYVNSHGFHHRHFMGNEAPVEFPGYEALLARFEREVRWLWQEEDERGY